MNVIQFQSSHLFWLNNDERKAMHEATDFVAKKYKSLGIRQYNSFTEMHLTRTEKGLKIKILEENARITFCDLPVNSMVFNLSFDSFVLKNRLGIMD